MTAHAIATRLAQKHGRKSVHLAERRWAYWAVMLERAPFGPLLNKAAGYATLWKTIMKRCDALTSPSETMQ